MSDDKFRYDLMVEDALRGVVRHSLERAAQEGLPGNHHFYITFKTAAQRVDIPTYLKERYPDEMTIVLQYQFWNLQIDEDHFEVTLSFNDIRERLVIPFMAMTGFADPSVQFGLQFQLRDENGEFREEDDGGSASSAGKALQAVPDAQHDAAATDTPEDTSEEDVRGEVVSLDQFRKKK